MMFPALFAVPGSRVYDDDASNIDRVCVFQTRLVRGAAARGGGGGWGYGREDYDNDDTDADVYYVTPFRVVRGPDHYGDGGDDSFVVEGRFGAQQHHREFDRVTLRTQDRDRGRSDYHYDFGYDTPGIRRDDPTLLYRGIWRHTGYTVFSMYCAQPIPLLEFGSGGGSTNIHWPAPPSTHYHRLVVVPAPPRNIVPVWARRWNPDTWHREIAELVEERRAARRAAAAPPAPAPAPAPVRAPAPAAAGALPSFVADLIITDAVAKNVQCPITMEPITKESAAVTPCYHVFDATALAAWVASATADGAPPLCPQCRARL